MRGSELAIRYGRRDLDNIKVALQYVRKFDTVIQAGGCIGIFPKELSKTFKTVYTFEPDPINFRIMGENVSETNVILIQAALSNVAQFVSTVRARRDGSSGKFNEGCTHISDTPGNIPAITLDDFGFDECDFLCLDVEGWEYYALDGASELIYAKRPVIMVEVNKQMAAAGVSLDEFKALMARFNYKFAERSHSDEIYIPAEYHP